jgi:AraC-like DNA-binding protein/quercetin dioxygenase-like cupin family protein
MSAVSRSICRDVGPNELATKIGDGFDVRSLGLTYQTGHVVKEHSHAWAQLVYAKSGLMSVETGGNVWFVPPTKAVWIPPRAVHRIEFTGQVQMRTLYISPARAMLCRKEVETIGVSALLSQLIQHIQAQEMLDPAIPEHDHLASVLMDLIASAPALDMVLPQPVDNRANQLARLIRENPAQKSDLSHLSNQVGASLRTMQRCFRAETGLSLDAWRQKSRLIHALAHLTDGASVTDAALECGYESTSAFIVVFKKHFGVTPGRLAKVS